MPPIDNRVLEDFRAFLFIVWKHLGLPDPTPVQYDIAHFIQHAPDRAIVEAFRGIGKSYITSAYVCWRLLKDPQIQILVVSASKFRSDSFTTFTKKLIREIPILQHLQPRSDQRDSNVAFDVAPAKAADAPSVRSVGVMGQMTGGRADLIIPDDVEVPNNSDTQGGRDKLAERVKEFEAILKPNGRILYLGTPQCEMSLYNQLEASGYTVRVWPVKYPTLDSVPRYRGTLAPFITNALERHLRMPNDSVEPTRFSTEDLMIREAQYGRSGFALQFMLDTSLSDQDKYPLKLKDLIVMDLNTELAPSKVVWCNAKEKRIEELPAVGLAGDAFYRPMYVSENWTAYQGSILAIDPSGRGKDKTAYCVIKMLHGILYVVDQGVTSGGYDDKSLRELTQVAMNHKVNVILVESNFGDGMFTQLLSPILNRVYPCTIEEVRHHTQKELRIIDTLEPVLNQHRLVFDSALVKKDYETLKEETERPHRLFYQLTRITKDKGALSHDDALDCLAMGVRYWVDQMGTDIETAEAQFNEDLRKKELDKFLQGFDDNPFSSSDTWM